MKKLIFMLMAGSLLSTSNAALAEETLFQWLTNVWREKEVMPVGNKTYKEECGSCHLAYQPGLLPAKSWEKLLTEKALNEHFGENAALGNAALKEIHDYAVANAADKSWHKRSRKVAAATAEGDAPLRITELRFIKRTHQKIPEKMIKGNQDVKSLSYCNACHTQAEDGVYDSDTVSIPNYPGRKN